MKELDVKQVLNVTFPIIADDKWKTTVVYVDTENHFQTVSEYSDTYVEALKFYMKYYPKLVLKNVLKQKVKDYQK